MDHNQQGQSSGRRHFHRGRRGPDRRGPDRRGPDRPAHTPEHGSRNDVDVEQIMRDIRARIAQRNGIELTNQQIQELAARRLESILDLRTVKPALLDQLRRAAGNPVESPAPAAPAPAYTFEDTTIYESHSGLMRFFRKLLHPFLKLLFNPNPLIRALSIQSRVNAEAAARDAESARRQVEWNALHYELLQRVVTEIARVSLEMQHLSLKVDSLAGKVDFNERRVRGIEGMMHQSRPAAPPRRDAGDAPSAPPPAAVAAADAAGTEAAGQPLAPSADGPRRRRRRRRGRRGSGGPATELAPGSVDAAALESDVEGPDGPEGNDLDDAGEEEAAVTVESVSYQAESVAAPPFDPAPIQIPSIDSPPADAGPEPPAVDSPQERRDTDSEG